MTQDPLAYLSTPLRLRAELEAMVRRDLLGPAGGSDEELTERVSDRYIVGLVAPRGQSILPDEQDDPAAGGDNGDQDGRTEAATLPTASMLPSSIGLTFTVDGAASAIQVVARWGHYRRMLSQALPQPDDKPRLVWKRRQVAGTSEPFRLQPGEIGPWQPDPESPEVYVRGLCRRSGACWTITLFLVNSQQEPKSNKDEAWLFQPELIVRAPHGEPIFVKRQLPAVLNVADPEDRAVEMLYRRDLEFAVGHGIAIHADLAPTDLTGLNWQRAVAVRTEVMPSYEVERMEPPDPTDVPPMGATVTDMQTLANLAQGQFGAALTPLTNAYAAWIAAQEERLVAPAPDLAIYADVAASALAGCRAALERIRAGITVLDADPAAAQAFRFANRAMQLQRIRSIFARETRQGGQPDLEQIDVPANRTWRPFQLAFILLNLPALADPRHPDRSDAPTAAADLLWFPTGGGKTEAYLGVAAFTMAIRRLQGEVGGLSGAAGVAVLMRYTLRLLTLQQFQRAATLICACEMIRREDPGAWGAEPFRIGLWVGQRSTPNWTKDAAEAIKQDRDTGFAGGGGTPYQLTNCPWCGRPIEPGRDIWVDTYEQGSGRTFQYCSDPIGLCPFSRRQSPDEGIPILVVDEEIYRRLPSLLIATVDKFAQMPWKGPTAMLFGRVNGFCPRHGFRSPEIEDSDSHPKRGKFPAVKTQPIGPLRPPDLIIQDELHLISGPLGTLVGLYETAVDELATWQLDGQRVRPKVIASTATIRRAQVQINSLFLRQVKVFPPAGLDADDTFFARRQSSGESTPGRLYLGVCAPGTRLKTLLIRVYLAYMAGAQALFNRCGKAADPWMTLVGYFNSMRELGGVRRVVDDAVRSRLREMDERGLARRFITPWGVDELTSRKNAADIPRLLSRLEAQFERGQETGRRGQKTDFARQPLDVVLATNMISVGVDVNRLGLMVVASQPKATAEYIQATSRVGRGVPGIVCTVYNWARPRDLSHYERFEHYHATFYQHVEALSVTPFSPRALDRGLMGVLASVVRLQGEDFNANERAGQVTAQHPFVTSALARISRRAGLVEASNAAEELTQQMTRQRLDAWLARRAAISGGAILGYEGKTDGRTLGLLSKPTQGKWELFTCLNSLRDVEPSVKLILRDYGMDRENAEPTASAPAVAPSPEEQQP